MDKDTYQAIVHMRATNAEISHIVIVRNPTANEGDLESFIGKRSPVFENIKELQMWIETLPEWPAFKKYLDLLANNEELLQSIINRQTQ